MVADVQSVWQISGVPVLMYHGIKNTGAAGLSRDKYCLDENRFAAQLDQCARAALPVVSLKNHWSKVGDSKDVVVFTFDDGLSSDYEIAFPRLSERGCSADFFVNSSTVGRPGYVSWEQLKEMDRAGMSVQSHGLEHVPLTLLRGPILREQLSRGKAEIEHRIGSKVEFLSAPFGFLNSRVTNTALEVGFTAVCDSVSWPALMGNKLIHRIVVERGTSDRAFQQLVSRLGTPFAIRSLRRNLLHIPKEILLRLAPQLLGLPAEAHP